MKQEYTITRYFAIFCCLCLYVMISFSQTARDIVKGNLIQFNDNGAWCWYQDERAIIDIKSGKIILGSCASGPGVGGFPRSGDLESVIYDINTGSYKKYTLKEGDAIFYCDDHNTPAFLRRPDGKYLSIYTAHFGDTSSYYRIYDNGIWSPEKSFNWKKMRPGGSNFQTTYSNIFYLSSENRVYNFVRGNNKSPNFMVSSDYGDTWTYGGQLSTNANIGYNNGYYKYCSNGIDRIDFICSDYHPRDFNTSIFHGYISNGKMYKSDGTLIDDNIFDTLNIPSSDKMTMVFAGGTVINNQTMYRCWNTDVYRYDDGTIATVITARVNNDVGGSSNDINPNHAFIYCRFDGSKWNSTYLCDAGLKMFASEQDYTGLATISPIDPNTIYISSTYDPRDNTSLGVHEIFKGVTSDKGNTWSWTPITQKSIRDNFRPIMPIWDKNNSALLWWRGTYTNAQTYDAAIVGLFDRKLESSGKMTYVDADLNNTSKVDGSAFSYTGPDSNSGSADSRWHLRTGYGNNSTVICSGEVGGENCQALKTTVTVPREGMYDVWVNFWGNPTADWRIKAGLSSDGMQLYRSMACKEVDSAAHTNIIVRTGNNNVFLYQAYVGRVTVTSDKKINVFVDDSTVKTGTISTQVGDNSRTWYDGISYAPLNIVTAISKNEEIPEDFKLDQNYPNPFNPSTKISYSIPKSYFVSLIIFDVLGREIQKLINGYQTAGKHTIDFNANGLTSGVYFYRVKTGDGLTDTKKMILIR